MIYCVSSADMPAEYLGSGNLISDDGFVHPRRQVDIFVFILMLEGTLHITQGTTAMDIGPHEYLLLRPDTLHFGHAPSSGRLSYYWVHFRIQSPHFLTGDPGTLPASSFLIPERGKISSGDNRVRLLFVQMLDIARRDEQFLLWQCHYALSTLLLEITAQVLREARIRQSDIPPKLAEIMEWIRCHYEQDLTVAGIAERFHYHPTYLASLFRKHTGLSVLAFVNQTRFQMAQSLLTGGDQPVYLIALSVGFRDEKYFLRQFKKFAGMTPTQYRDAFRRKMLNVI